VGQLIETRYALTPAAVRPLPNLLEVSIKAFEWFCFQGIREVFDEVFPIISNDENYELHFEDYEIVLPTISERDCFERDENYSANLRGVFSFHNNKTGEIKESKEVFICELPFLTRNGTFIINGVERVVVNQLVRAPGVYFTKGEKRTANENAHMVKLIPYRGAWLRYEYDVKTASYQVRMDSPRRVLKIPMMDFLRALGFEVDYDKGRIFLPDKLWDTYGLDAEAWPDAEMKVGDELDGTLQRDSARTMRDAQIEIWRKLHPTDPYSDEVLDAMLPSRFFDPKRYDLARVGRYMLNKKLNLHVRPEITTLTVADMLEAFKKLHALQIFNEGQIDDIDHLNLENRRVEHVGELLVSQLRKGLLRLERIVREKMMLPDADKETPKNLINTRPIIGVVKEFFGSSQMSQFMDNTNPLTSLTHKRRFSALGPKGLTREAARFDFRDVHHSHYGRICPIESPEGPNIGLISSLAAFARVNEYGFIETPYFMVDNGKVGSETVYLSADQELDLAIAPSTTKRDDEGNITERVLFVRRHGNFEQVSLDEVQYVEIAPNQFISVTTSLIPFLEHDDANRALMGSNMQRQGVPLLYPASPVVGTGLERKLAEDAGGVEISPFCGEVAYVDSTRFELRKGIVYDKHTGEILDFPNLERIYGEEVLDRSKFDYIFTPPGEMHELYRKLPFEDRGYRRLKPQFDVILHRVIDNRDKVIKALREITGMDVEEIKSLLDKLPRLIRKKVSEAEADEIVIKLRRAGAEVESRNRLVESLNLRKFQRSNQGTLINQRVQVRKGFPVIKGDLLADSASTDMGELALGKNMLVGFMSWRGYNYEDAILCSESLLKRADFTSIHIEKHECEARNTKLGPEKITSEVTGLQEDYIKRYLDERGVIRLGAEVKSGDVLVGKITPKGESDLTGEEKLIRAVFGDKGKGYKNTPLKLPHGEDGVIIDTQYFNIKHECLDCGRFFSEKDVEEKFKSKKPMKCPTCGSEHYKPGDTLGHNVVEMARVFVVKRRHLQVGDKMAGRHGNKGVVSNILPIEDMAFLPDGTPLDIILNPLGVPSRMNIGQVLETHLGLACSQIAMEDENTIDEVYAEKEVAAMDKYQQDIAETHKVINYKRHRRPLKVKCPVFLSPSEDKIRAMFKRLRIPQDGKTTLYDGMTGEPFKERVMVGVMYMMKLNHLVDDKIHARSTGSYALITQQPLGGKAQFGGQRLGEMEVWALEGYGAAYLLKEMLTVKSDDVKGRSRTYKAIVDGEIIPEPGIPESFYVMVNELRSLGLNVEVFKNDVTVPRERNIFDASNDVMLETTIGEDSFDQES
jgi:DNA-directed RNA polymerase subunit beta